MPVITKNRKAYFNYEILEELEVGLVLRGWEVKSLKNHGSNLKGVHALVRGGELYLLGLDISPYQPGNMPEGAESGRTIKLLANKDEIAHMAVKVDEGRMTLVPLQLYTKAGILKLKLGLVRGKKKFDKREKIKKRDEGRRIAREAK